MKINHHAQPPNSWAGLYALGVVIFIILGCATGRSGTSTFGGKTLWSSEELISHVKGKTTEEILKQFGTPKEVDSGGQSVFYWSYKTGGTVIDDDSKKRFRSLAIYFSRTSKMTIPKSPILFFE